MVRILHNLTIFNVFRQLSSGKVELAKRKDEKLNSKVTVKDYTIK